MKKIFSLLVFFLVLGLMYITNPTKNDYTEFVKVQLDVKVNENNSPGKLDNIIGDVLSGAGARIASSMTERKEYYFASLYTLKTNGKTYNYLGLFSNFIPLQTDNPLEDTKDDE